MQYIEGIARKAYYWYIRVLPIPCAIVMATKTYLFCVLVGWPALYINLPLSCWATMSLAIIYLLPDRMVGIKMVAAALLVLATLMA